MMLRYTYTGLLALLCTSFAYAQLLTNGNSQFPQCASTCTLLNQAAQACGGTASANQAIWACFCQSAYLTSLKSSPTGICDAFCTNPTDNQQVMTWFNSNCGQDNGASEHPDSGTNAGATTVVITSTSSAVVGPSSANVASNAPSATSASGTVASDADAQQNGSWFSNHWKWVVMLIVIFVGLLLLALIAVWLKRRHDRKADQVTSGFNQGITSRTTAMSQHPRGAPNGPAGLDAIAAATPANVVGSGSGRNSPARTREAFMPYGYGYARSESRLASRGEVNQYERASPLARGGTPMNELEKQADLSGTTAQETPTNKKSRRVLVRERTAESAESPEIEKIPPRR